MMKSSLDLVALEIFCFVGHQQLSETAWLAHSISTPLLTVVDYSLLVTSMAALLTVGPTASD